MGEEELYFEFSYTISTEGMYAGCRFTFCKIWDIPYDERNNVAEPIGRGRAICVPQDNFRRTVGRKLAFTRALRATGFGKAKRTEVWTKYFERIKR